MFTLTTIIKLECAFLAIAVFIGNKLRNKLEDETLSHIHTSKNICCAGHSVQNLFVHLKMYMCVCVYGRIPRITVHAKNLSYISHT